jgi:hypothetical protein
MSRRSGLFGVGITTLPSWADYTALPSGQFIEFTTNTPSSSGVNMPRNVLYNWCGGSFVPDFGARGGVGYCGGGEHSTWTDSRADGGIGQNGAYMLDCDARVYVRRCYPVVDHAGVDSAGNGGPSDNWGAYTNDGAPQSKHTYNGMSYMPAAWGGGSSGSLMRVGHGGGISTSLGPQPTAYAGGYAATWRYDLSKASHSVADQSIIKLTGSQTYDYGTGTPAKVNDAPIACIDTTREGWWSTHRTGGSGPWGDRMVFTSKAGVISAPQGQSLGTGWATLHHFADDDILVRITDHNVGSVTPIWQVFVWQAGTANAWVQAPVNRQAIADTYENGTEGYPSVGYMMPRWSTILGCFVGLDWRYLENTLAAGASTTTVRIWKFTPPPAGQRFSGTWQITYELVTAKSGTEATNFMILGQRSQSDAGVSNGVFGRFVECPSLRAFVWTRDYNKPGQLIRLQGM